MARVEQDGAGESRSIVGLHRCSLEADAVVTLQDRLLLAPVTASDASIALPDLERDVGDLVAIRLAAVNDAAERRERLHEERADEAGLETARFGLLHLFLHAEESFR